MSDNQRDYESGPTPGDDTDVNLRAYLSRLTDEHLRESDPPHGARV